MVNPLVPTIKTPRDWELQPKKLPLIRWAREINEYIHWKLILHDTNKIRGKLHILINQFIPYAVTAYFPKATQIRFRNFSDFSTCDFIIVLELVYMHRNVIETLYRSPLIWIHRWLYHSGHI